MSSGVAQPNVGPRSIAKAKTRLAVIKNNPTIISGDIIINKKSRILKKVFFIMTKSTNNYPTINDQCITSAFSAF